MLQQVSERIFVAPGGANIGVVFGPDSNAILIDAGLNDTAVRKVLRRLAELYRRVSSIITTHGHADHFGGNAFVVKRTGARVWAPIWDEAILKYPLFQPMMLYAGADPPASLRGGFLLAEASPVDEIYEDGPMTIDGVDFTAVPLAGHSGNQTGIVCDDVFFSADIALPERVLERYKIPYLHSVRDHLRSLDRAETVGYRTAMPGHGPITENLSPLIESNRSLVLDVAESIVEICARPRCPGDILAELLRRYGADPQDAAGYYLLHPTMYAYLTYLEDAGKLAHRVESGRSLWVSG